MSKLFELVGIDVKPEVGVYIRLDNKGDYADTMPFDPDGWFLYNSKATHYLRPVIPPASAIEAAERYVQIEWYPDIVAKGENEQTQQSRKDFLAGYSLAAGQGWVKVEDGCAMPDEGERVDLYCDSGYRCIGYWYKDKWERDTKEWRLGEYIVTHYRKLSPPPINP